ncbi:hypothetical protein MN116_000151 [Schistosoma mekongi]|uniref:Uncharacterized protein n=1 Tax=Schistosoma mekongi TaxID=38744 RepID=A0AAE1Z933_SCHME|nr:hypothetical protein MN116_000151 [Schistosoma mekongi]
MQVMVANENDDNEDEDEDENGAGDGGDENQHDDVVTVINENGSIDDYSDKNDTRVVAFANVTTFIIFTTTTTTITTTTTTTTNNNFTITTTSNTAAATTANYDGDCDVDDVGKEDVNDRAVSDGDIVGGDDDVVIFIDEDESRDGYPIDDFSKYNTSVVAPLAAVDDDVDDCEFVDGVIVNGDDDVNILINSNQSINAYSDSNATGNDDNVDCGGDVNDKCRWQVFRYICCCR